MKPSCLPLFPQTLEIAKQRRFHTFPPHDGYGAILTFFDPPRIETFLSGANTMNTQPEGSHDRDPVTLIG
ncbi:hypothetical protein BDD14_3937 [Edaphobacter modestus]|uniref:Uncharacterized protein n=1 Tax=Edaphobacter modestus TaxID=388466 RepID=A0A4Q7YXA1_9BACT|nr:hypothetical protein BDD14_3937 [Edaphobacter modestus]